MDAVPIPELTVLCSPDGDGATFCRPDSSHKVWLAGCTGWHSLGGTGRDAVCSLIWPGSVLAVRDFRVLDPVTGEVVGTHTLLPP